MGKKKIRVTKEIEVVFNEKDADVSTLKMLDDMSSKETSIGISRAQMIKIAILEAYNKRFGSSKK